MSNSEKKKYQQDQRKSWPLWDLPGQTVNRFFLGRAGSAKILSKERSFWTKHQDFEQRAVLLDKVPGFWAKHGFFGKRARFLEKAQIFRKAHFLKSVQYFYIVYDSVADPDPDPPDPHVLGPPGSRSTSQRYGSESGSFYHHAKIVRKTLIPTILRLFLTFYLWKMM